MQNDNENYKEINNVIRPRVMIAAAGSSNGKTTLTCALLKHLDRLGKKPVSFKCGPDYIDPMFHRIVLGIESGNLDTFFMSEDEIRNNIATSEGGCTVIEGVMGLYDGVSPDSLKGSSYEIAEITDTPIILVADASGAGRTIISTVKGILADDRARLIKGVILNRMSEGFYKKLKPVMEEELTNAGYEAALLGAIPKNNEISVGSRYLGLMLPSENRDVSDKIEKAANMVEEYLDVGALLEIMKNATPLSCKRFFALRAQNDTAPADACMTEQTTQQPKEQPSKHSAVQSTAFTTTQPTAHPIIAVARDKAFCFYYGDNLRRLEAAGAKIRYFSPLHDSELPEDTRGIILGGGYPELYLKELSSNHNMLEEIRTAITSGIPTLAECGGYMYLHKSIISKEGESFDMVGIVDGECSFTGRSVRFGYLELSSGSQNSTNPLEKHINGIRGHEFHYFDSTASGGICTAAKPDGSKSRQCMLDYNDKGLFGFPHLYYTDEFALEFVKSIS